MSPASEPLELRGETTEERLAEVEAYFAAHSRRPFHGERAPGRNDKCWCGSGKKYKRCHLVDDEQRRLTPGSTGHGSMSDNLHAVVQPLVDRTDNPGIAELRKLFTMAAAVWSVTRSAESPAELVAGLDRLKQLFHDSAGGQLDEQDRAAIDDVLNVLARQALVTAPADRRLVAKVQVTETRDGFRVDTASLAAAR